MKSIAIIGSTGSIGTQTLDIVRNRDDIKVVAIAAASSIDLLEKQIFEFHPKLVCVWSQKNVKVLRERMANTTLSVEIVFGMDGLIQIAEMEESDLLITAIVGMIGIKPTLAAIRAGKNIGLANKETLVAAGHIIMKEAKIHGVSVFPVDSEHSAIFQCLNGENKEQLSKIILTASGGPFRGMTKSELEKVTLKQALKHPNWSMGTKITVDSATLVNKGLEVIEAKWLFDIDIDDIEVLIQPQSIIHSMVEFIDGSIMAQLGTPNMRLPIQYALFYPERKELLDTRLDFREIATLDFAVPDTDTFKGLEFGYKAGRIGGSMPTVLNAANELAVAKFSNEKIRFLEIYEIIEYCMEEHKLIQEPTLEEILEIEKWVYELIESRWN